MIRYVAGFLFNECCTSVALIRKAKPAWQAGRLNAIGGKIEPGETPEQAMEREFFEEAGVKIPAREWDIFAILKGSGWECYFYSAAGDVTACKKYNTLDDGALEELEIVEVDKAKLFSPKDSISNVPWLLGLALNTNAGIEYPVVVNYQ